VKWAIQLNVSPAQNNPKREKIALRLIEKRTLHELVDIPPHSHPPSTHNPSHLSLSPSAHLPGFSQSFESRTKSDTIDATRFVLWSFLDSIPFWPPEAIESRGLSELARFPAIRLHDWFSRGLLALLQEICISRASEILPLLNSRQMKKVLKQRLTAASDIRAMKQAERQSIDAGRHEQL
jgi:hypothetical protein